MTIQNHKHFRKLVPGYRWLVVRIWWDSFKGHGGYSVAAQSTERAEALTEARKWLRSGGVVIRDRITGERFCIAELEKLCAA